MGNCRQWPSNKSIKCSIYSLRITPQKRVVKKPWKQLTNNVDGNKVRRVRSGWDLALVQSRIRDFDGVDAQFPRRRSVHVKHFDPVTRGVQEVVDCQQSRVAVSDPRYLKVKNGFILVSSLWTWNHFVVKEGWGFADNPRASMNKSSHGKYCSV